MNKLRITLLMLLIGFGIWATSTVSVYANETKPIGYLDQPLNGAQVKGKHLIRGWFLDPNQVAKIEISLNGSVIGEATYGKERQDVDAAFPAYANTQSGFEYLLDTTGLPDGQHTLVVKETNINGQTQSLAPVMFTVSNVKSYVDTPVVNSTASGTVNVRGWLLDEAEVARIEVLVDGALNGEATYGLARPDVYNAFPQYKNGQSGFEYPLDTTRYSDGSHMVTIKSEALNGRVINVASIPINITNVKGYIDNPGIGKVMTGLQNISGWFLDGSGVSNIDVLVDGKIVGQATYGDERTDVYSAFPQFTNRNAGFHYQLDTTEFNDGTHKVTVRETGRNGYSTTLSEREVVFSNTKGFIDKPAINSFVAGTSRVSGWFLDGSGVSKIEILVDGIVKGEGVYGSKRADVLQAFPQYKNDSAGFYYDLDTSQLSDGAHIITLRETGLNGYMNTLPPTPFYVSNIKAYVDNPAPGTTTRGIQTMSGWVLDKSGVATVEVMVDGSVIGQANYGVERQDVLKAFPDFNNSHSGFTYTLDTTKFSNSYHAIALKVTGINGKVSIVPISTIKFNQAQKIFLDPGHGGSDPGAIAGGVRESDLNLTVAKKVQSLLLNRGYDVYMSRAGDTTVGLYDRPQMANNIGADLFVSIHTNSASSSSATGIESYFYEYDPSYPSKINTTMHNNPERIAKSMTLANLIQNNMISYTGAVNRGTDGNSLAVIRESAMPATLLEMGFINNSSDRQKLVSSTYQDQLASAIADAIDQYFRMY